MATHSAVAQTILKDWLEKNQQAPRFWRALAQRLATHHDMPSAWRELAKHGDVVMPMFSIVHTAFEQAAAETRRQSTKEETTQLQRVRKLALQLKEAIEQSPLPRNSTKMYTLLCENRPEAHLMLGWRDLQQNGFGLGYPLSIVEVLDIAVHLLDEHVQNLPLRSVKRHHKRPQVAAFVRFLAWHFGRRFGKEMHGTVARITTAVFDISKTDPLDKKGVQAILKNRPVAFVPLTERDPAR